MTQPGVRITQLNLIAADFGATSRFWREIGFEVPEPTAQPPGTLHAEVDAGAIRLAIDDEPLAAIYHAAARRDELRSRALIGVTVASREAVDAIWQRLLDAGFEGRQRPYDAFWGARYAIVADPSGNDVGLMSPPDPALAHWPPRVSPD